MTKSIEYIACLVVGVVESVKADEIKVLLEIDAPHATALNTGTPSAFPRINSYILIPNEAGATVGYIAGIGIERSPYPKRSGLKDFGLIDLPFPLRKMTVCPVGTLTSSRNRATGTIKYELTRGVVAFPSVGDQVLMPTAEQIEAIVGARDPDKRVRIGVSPLSANATIQVDPNKIFGRHLAVLGNTGSGKSCSVAGLIRWSLEAAKKAFVAKGEKNVPNARFIILDSNGEYRKAFQDMTDECRVFRPGDDKNPFVLPAWMWNCHEWSTVTHAQPGAQRPLLLQALRNLRTGRTAREPIHISIVRQVHLYRAKALAFIADATGESYSSYVGMINCCDTFGNLSAVMGSFVDRVEDATQRAALEAIITASQGFHDRHKVWNEQNKRSYYNPPNAAEFETFLPLFENLKRVLPEVSFENTISEDAPIPFDISQLANYIDDLSAEGGSNANVSNFIATLTLRIRSMLADQRMRPVIAPDNPPEFQEWLEQLIGADAARNGQIAVVDLSLVPSDVTHIVIAVLARLVFEAMQRYRKLHPDGKPFPTVLVLEEAHTFVNRSGTDEDRNTPAHLCREAFERIAREGRKFGLGLVLSSQRPSELLPTVLAQCNTFLLHRIVNDRDQELVSRLVPDNLGGLLRELPSLPFRHAILLGWATAIPVLVEIDELKKEHRPQSADPDFWEVWTGVDERAVDWGQIADDWTGEYSG